MPQTASNDQSPLSRNFAKTRLYNLVLDSYAMKEQTEWKIPGCFNKAVSFSTSGTSCFNIMSQARDAVINF